MSNYLIKNAQIVNEGKIFTSDLLIKNGRIELAKDKISYEVAEREILKIASQFPVHNLRQYNKLMKQRLIT